MRFAMNRRVWSAPSTILMIVALAACGRTSGDPSGKPPVPGGPWKDPDAISRRGGNGPGGLDKEVLLIGIAPDRGPTAGGTAVFIAGLNFLRPDPVREVLFDNVPVLDFSVLSNTQIDAVTPPHAEGRVAVTLRTGGGSEDTLSDVYEYVAPPPPPPPTPTCLTLNPNSA